MSDPYVLHGTVPHLQHPLLVVYLTGWIDASGAAAAALSRIDDACRTVSLATFDSDLFVDYRARRPTIELRNGVSDRIMWHEIEMKWGHDPNGRAVVTLGGPEPDSNWRKFYGAVGELAQRLGIEQMIGLGAFPYAVPHTRTPLLSVVSPSAELIRDLPHQKASIDMPGGMSAVLEHTLTELGIPCVGLWSQVPHYVSTMTFPQSSMTLLRGVREVAGLQVDMGPLEREAVIQHNRITELVEGNDEHRAMVKQLEVLYDREQEQANRFAETDIPSSDELAAEVERFLRDQGQ